MGKHWFLLRLVILALARRKSRVTIAFAAIVLGVAIVSGLANVYYDIGRKMTRELRTYGANLVLTPVSLEEQPYLSLNEIVDIAGRVPLEQLVGYSPYLYGIVEMKTYLSSNVHGVVKTASYQAVLAGTDFTQISQVSPYWKITGSAPFEGSQDTVVGEALARKLGITAGSHLELTAEDGQTIESVVTGILSTGGKEENIVFINLDTAAGLLNKPGIADVAYFSIATTPDELESLVQNLKIAFPSIDAAPIKQVSQAEGRVLVKIQSLVLLATGIILLLTLLCLVITMMNIAMERRGEIGLRKALGGQDRDVILEFVIEGSILGLVGGILGWILGLLLAQGIGQSVFHAPITIRLPVLPLTIVVATALAGLAAFIPAKFAARVQPAIVLRGE